MRTYWHGTGLDTARDASLIAVAHSACDAFATGNSWADVVLVAINAGMDAYDARSEHSSPRPTYSTSR